MFFKILNRFEFFTLLALAVLLIGQFLYLSFSMPNIHLKVVEAPGSVLPS